MASEPLRYTVLTYSSLALKYQTASVPRALVAPQHTKRAHNDSKEKDVGMRLELSSPDRVSRTAGEDASRLSCSFRLSPPLSLPLPIEAHILGVSDPEDSAQSRPAKRARTQMDWCHQKTDSVAPVSKQLSDRLTIVLAYAQSPSCSSIQESHLRGQGVFGMSVESARPNHDYQRPKVSSLSHVATATHSQSVCSQSIQGTHPFVAAYLLQHGGPHKFVYDVRILISYCVRAAIYLQTFTKFHSVFLVVYLFSLTYGGPLGPNQTFGHTRRARRAWPSDVHGWANISAAHPTLRQLGQHKVGFFINATDVWSNYAQDEFWKEEKSYATCQAMYDVLWPVNPVQPEGNERYQRHHMDKTPDAVVCALLGGIPQNYGGTK